MPQKTKQKGSAVIVALFVVALTTIAAIAMITRLQQDVERTRLVANDTQANLYVQGSVIWAEDQLIHDWKSHQQGQVIDKTPMTSPIDKNNNATIMTTIQDAQSFFNINNLTDAKSQLAFMRLVKTLSPKISDNDNKNLTAAIVDWITPVHNSQNDAYYATLTPAYRAPHRLIVSVSELRLVKGMTRDLYSTLFPYVIALPVSTNLNINNAQIPVLMALSPTLTIDAAKTIRNAAADVPFATLEQFNNFDVVKNNPFSNGSLTTTSTYFLVTTYVTIADLKTVIFTLLERDVQNNQPTITILWQLKGAL